MARPAEVRRRAGLRAAAPPPGARVRGGAGHWSHAAASLRRHPLSFRGFTDRPRRARIGPDQAGTEEDHRMDKKAKTPKKPKQTKAKDGAKPK